MLLYEAGHSLKAISTLLRVPKTSVRGILIHGGVELRAHSKSQTATFEKPRQMSIKTAPYGYCLVDGQLKEDHWKIKVVTLILNWWRSGLSQMAITKKLNEQKIKPRFAVQWSQPTVRLIIRRFSSKNERDKF